MSENNIEYKNKVEAENHKSINVDADKNIENNQPTDSLDNQKISEWNKMEGKTDNRNPIIKFFEKFGDLFFLNLIFVLSCLPIVTIGAAFVNLYYITNKMVVNQEETLWKGYWKGFKKNFVIGTKLLVFWMVFFAVIYLEYILMFVVNQTVFTNIIVVLIGLEMVYFSFSFPMMFPIAARYTNGIIKHAVNAFIISVSHLKTWLVLFAAWLIPVFAMLMKPIIFAYTWYLWLLILFSTIAYTSSLAMQPIYKQLEERTEDVSEGNEH